MRHALLKNWTPTLAHRFAFTRIKKIEFLLEEIANCYADVDQAVVNEVDAIYMDGLDDLKSAVATALEEGKTLF